MSKSICSVDGCERPVYGRGWCNMHWQRIRRTGSPGPASAVKRGPKPQDVAVRFWAKVDKSGPGGCWIWQAALLNDASGYGVISVGGKSGRMVLAHRVSYELVVGPIPEGAILDHKCRVRRCVNPAHLQPSDFLLNNQNRGGANVNSKTGVRNVNWKSSMRKYEVSIMVSGERYHGGFFADLAQAEAAAVAMRNLHMTNNLADRRSA